MQARVDIPWVPEFVPGHVMQDEAPMYEYCPTGQRLQFMAPEIAEYVPAGQSMHKVP